MAASSMEMCLKRLPLWRNVLTSSRRFSESSAAPHYPRLKSDQWESVVGLEIHAQINVNSKLFSKASTKYGAATNTQVSYFDAAIPGTLPVLNKYCVEAAIKTALALNCTVHKISAFDRKHYFYSDLPAGYQITQQFYPIATNGRLDFMVYSNELRIKPYPCSVRLKQLQLEQDSGRSLHTTEGKSFIDLNRAGAFGWVLASENLMYGGYRYRIECCYMNACLLPNNVQDILFKVVSVGSSGGIGLMELVFEPDLKNGEEAAVLVKELQMLLTYLGTCTCEMEEGALRVDANISINRVGEPFGVRTEVKNLNSFRFLAKAIDFEINRQVEVLESGGYIVNETRGYDFKEKKTMSMRDKEVFQDYRFMPEPNLPPIKLYDDCDYNPEDKTWGAINIDDIRRELPVLPSAHRQRLIDTYVLPYETADRIVKNETSREYFEVAAAEVSNKLIAANVILNNIQHQLNVRKLSFKECPVCKFKIKELAELMDKEAISEGTLVDILGMLFNGDQRSPKEIVETYNWHLVTDEKVLEEACLRVFEKRSKMAKKFKNTGRRKFLTSLLVGVNEDLQHRVPIKRVEYIIIRLLGNPKSGTDSED